MRPSGSWFAPLMKSHHPKSEPSESPPASNPKASTTGSQSSKPTSPRSTMAAESDTKSITGNPPKTLPKSLRQRYWAALRETAEWRAIALVLDFGIFWGVTGKLGLAVGLVGVEFVVKTTAFYFWRVARC